MYEKLISKPQTRLTSYDSENQQAILICYPNAFLSLFYRYYFGRCSDDLHSSMFPTFVASRPTRRVNSLHSFCVQVPQSRTVSRSSGFFVRTENQWNSLPANCFPDRYDLSAFKRRVDAYLKRVYPSAQVLGWEWPFPHTSRYRFIFSILSK